MWLQQRLVKNRTKAITSFLKRRKANVCSWELFSSLSKRRRQATGSVSALLVLLLSAPYTPLQPSLWKINPTIKRLHDDPLYKPGKDTPFESPHSVATLVNLHNKRGLKHASLLSPELPEAAHDISKSKYTNMCTNFLCGITTSRWLTAKIISSVHHWRPIPMRETMAISLISCSSGINY